MGCRFRAVIFDLDQTIVDTLGRFYRVFREVLRAYGLKEPSYPDFLEKYREDTLDTYIPPHIRERFWREFLARYRGPLSEVQPIPRVEEALRYVKSKGLRVAVITGRIVPNGDVVRELRHLGLDRYVDAVLTGLDGIGDDEDMFSKAPLVTKILGVLGVKPSQAMLIGDYRSDVSLSRKLGVTTVGVVTGHMDVDVLRRYGASFVIKSVAELPRLLRELGC